MAISPKQAAEIKRSHREHTEMGIVKHVEQILDRQLGYLVVKQNVGVKVKLSPFWATSIRNNPAILVELESRYLKAGWSCLVLDEDNYIHFTPAQ